MENSLQVSVGSRVTFLRIHFSWKMTSLHLQFQLRIVSALSIMLWLCRATSCVEMNCPVRLVTFLPLYCLVSTPCKCQTYLAINIFYDVFFLKHELVLEDLLQESNYF